MPRKAAAKAKPRPEPKGLTPTRKVRVEDELWEEATYLTKLAGTDCSKVMRDRLLHWVRQHRHEYPPYQPKA